MTDLRFAFGENWSDYAKDIDGQKFQSALNALRDMVGDLTGKTFLDIGCGSGIHAAAALSLGAKSVLAVDRDPASVATAKEVLTRHAPRKDWAVEERSVFDLDQRFDVVYSWGVLHHTGDMWRAIDHAARLVNPGGTLAIAIYHRTRLCDWWTKEKRFYCRSPKPIQAIIRWGWAGLLLARELRYGQSPVKLIRDYHRTNRGMTWMTNLHDWLGGYPYESATNVEVRAFMEERGFRQTFDYLRASTGSGFWGVGCSEYVFQRYGHPESGSTG